MNITQIIQKTALFRGLSSDSIDEISKNSHVKNYPKNRQIFQIGDPADSFFVILKGWIKLFRVSRDGNEVVIHVFGPGESFAEAAVFGDKRTYPVNAQAVSDIEIIEIPRSFFVHKIEEDHQFALRILASISSHQHYLVGQLEQITTRTAAQRIGGFLLKFCEKSDTENGEIVVDLPYDKSLISTRLNIKPETFSRALSKLEPHGVKIDEGRILICDAQNLTTFCDVSGDAL